MIRYLKTGRLVKCGRSLALLTAAIGMVGLADPAPADVGGDVSPDEIPGATKVDVEGSISLPDVKTTCSSLAKNISRKSAPVLFYCNGPRCGRSVNSSRKALSCGYTRVYWFRGGFEEWKKKNYPFVKE
jgi:rhodanese-related sulfurtransferase